MSPLQDDEHEVHVEPDPGHPGRWRITVDGCLASRHRDRAEALECAIPLIETLCEKAPTRLRVVEIDGDGTLGGSSLGGPGEDAGGDAS